MFHFSYQQLVNFLNFVLVLEQNALGKSAKKLFDVVKSFVKKLNVIMGFILMKRNNHIGSNTKELRYRRDIVFSQVVCRMIFSIIFIIF